MNTTTSLGQFNPIGFLVGWPIVMFLIAEPMRNLGKYTFADVVAFRLQQTPVRIASSIGTLVVVSFYLIAQMVGAGGLIQLLFGLDYNLAIVMIGCVMLAYVIFGGMIATTWVQIIKAVLLLGGATVMAILVLSRFGFNPLTLFDAAAQKYGSAVLAPGKEVANPLDAVSFATILAVVAGLTLSGAAALSHDLWVNVVKKGNSSETEQLKVARGATLLLGVLAMILGIIFKGQNVAYMVSLAFAISASANFPSLLMSMMWRGLTTKGAVASDY